MALGYHGLAPMAKFVLIIYGPPCSGKTEIVNLLFARHGGLFRVTADRTKWFISDYAAGKYVGIMPRMLLALASSAIAESFPLVVEGNTNILKGQWRDYQSLAEKHGARFFEVNLEAPLGILKGRFEHRIALAESRKIRIAVKNFAGVKQRYKIYLAHKKDSILTLDSSVLSQHAIAGKIEALVGLIPPESIEGEGASAELTHKPIITKAALTGK